jgi:hypothetical protein
MGLGLISENKIIEKLYGYQVIEEPFDIDVLAKLVN